MSFPPLGILAGSTRHFVTAFIAALKAGTGALPLPPENPRERLLEMLADAGCKTIVTESRHFDLARALAAESAAEVRVIVLDAEVDDGTGTVFGRREVERRPPSRAAVPPGDPVAYVVYTSGTTGRPKGVAVRHSNLLPLLRWQEREFELGPDVRAVQTLSTAFDFGLQEILTSVLFGATLVLPGLERVLDPAAYVELVDEQQVTMVYATPSYCEEIVAVGRPLPSVRVFLLGGEMLPAATVARLKELLDDCAIFNGYGPTEAAINCAMQRVDTAPGRPPAGVFGVGTATGASRVYTLDERLEPVPPGVVGEVCIGGDGVADGYLNKPRPTAEKFVPDPCSPRPGSRLYRSGDLGRRCRDGGLQLVGRRDEQVKLRGHRIELGEIVAALRAAEGVRDAAIDMREDLPGGRGIAAYYVPEPGTGADPARLRAQLAQKLPGYMVPAALVPLPALPRTPGGKLDRRALPRPQLSSSLSPAARPRGRMETLVAKAFCETLGLASVGREQSFFAIGGHSLLAARLQSRLEQYLHPRSIPVVAIFANPTVESLARLLAEGEDETSVRQSERRRRSEAERDRDRKLRQAQRSPA